MSEQSNNDLVREAYFKESGKPFHRDQYGLWFINAKNWESIRLQDTSDLDLRERAEIAIINETKQNPSTNRVSQFKINDIETGTIWINIENDDYGKSNISRKSLIDVNDESVFSEDFDVKKLKEQKQQGQDNNSKKEKRQNSIKTHWKVMAYDLKEILGKEIPYEPFSQPSKEFTPFLFKDSEDGQMKLLMKFDKISYFY